MSKTKKKTSTVLGVPVVSKKQKPKRSNPAAFKKGNPHRFVAGNGSPNPGGKVRSIDHLFSKNAPLVLGARASDEACKLLKLPTHSSISMCIVQRAALDAFGSSDPTVRADARAWLLQVTGELRMTLDVFRGFGGAEQTPPVVCLEFVGSDGDGRPDSAWVAAHPDYIDGKDALALPVPED